MEMYGMMGERLGVIGQVPDQLPQWKQDFLSKPSASIRRGIAWGTEPAYEDTSTLVLTSPSATFIDIRFPLSAQNPSEVAYHPSFWAFSGEASTTFYDAASTQPYSVSLPYTAHCKFLHDIDTRGRGIVDAGDMCLLPNGDSLECGHMVNPTTGRDEPYKEYWCSAEPLPNPDANSQDDSKVCLVANIASPSNIEGVAIRIGGRMQGIISRMGEDGVETIEVERWTRESGNPEDGVHESAEIIGPHGKWYRDPRSTGSFIPVRWLNGSGRSIGENMEYRDILWNLTEV